MNTFVSMEHKNYIIHKPYGYLSQFVNNQNKRKNKKLLGELYDLPEETMAIGRLDEDSEGLLLLTTNGKLSEQIRSDKVEKEYYVQVDGIVSEEEIISLRKGVEISINGKKFQTKKCAARIIDNPGFPERSRKVRDDRHGPTSWISVTISEGKFRQVRKMTAVVMHPTLRLIRVRIGAISLDSLKSGEIIENFDNFEQAFK